MGSLEPCRDPVERNELKNMVESLQMALHHHKQHIAAEVRDFLSAELTQQISNTYQSFAENLSRNLQQFEKVVKLELQNMSYKFETLESKSAEMMEKIKNLECLFYQKNLSVESELRVLSEKCIVSEQALGNFKELMKSIEGRVGRVNNEVVEIKDNVLANKHLLMSDVKTYVSEIRSEVESVRYESSLKVQNEIQKVYEKMFEFRGYIEQIRGKEDWGFEKKRNNLEEVFEYINAGLNKQIMELGNVRQRVERLEANDLICCEFRKSRGNF